MSGTVPSDPLREQNTSGLTPDHGYELNIDPARRKQGEIHAELHYPHMKFVYLVSQEYCPTAE